MKAADDARVRAQVCRFGDTSPVGRLRAAIGAIARRRWAIVVLQLVAVATLLFFFGWALRGSWDEAEPRVRDADLVELGASVSILGAYYLLFTVGWQRLLAAWGLRIPYFAALQAEMASILAKYVPGTVWVPAARVAALRRIGVRDTPLILSSMVLEAGLSAIAGILVFFVSLATVGFSDAPVLPLLALALIAIVGLHPRVFTPGARRLLRPMGGADLPPFPYRFQLALVAYYCFTWLVGGLALWFLLRSVGGDPAPSDIAYLGGVAAVSAIVAVLSLISPSGLGVREASMYGLLRAISPSGVALGATVLNRLTITIVEAVLLAVGAAAWRRRPGPGP